MSIIQKMPNHIFLRSSFCGRLTDIRALPIDPKSHIHHPKMAMFSLTLEETLGPAENMAACGTKVVIPKKNRMQQKNVRRAMTSAAKSDGVFHS